MLKTRNKIDYSAAGSYALERHGEQDHGSIKICDHLADVVEHVRKHYDPYVNICDPEEVIAAAWLHDLVEDTGTSPEDIHHCFGSNVGHLVDLLTDKEGKNRMERHLRTYHMIRQDPDATLIKLADRRHNHERSIKHGERWAIMYHREYLYFKFALYNPGQFVSLWQELDDQYKKLEDVTTW